MAQWFLIRNGQQHGPITDQQLKDLAAKGRIQPTDQVRRQDMTAPVLAGAIKGLFSKVATAAATPPPAARSLPVEPQATASNSAAWKNWIRIVLPLGAVTVALLKLAITKPKQAPSSPPAVQQNAALPSSPPVAPATPVASVPAIDLAKGRPQIDAFIQHMKRAESLEIHAPENGQDAAGTPFEFMNNEFQADCRIYIGGREQFGQNVSAILVEVAAEKQLGAIIVATPLDLKKPVGRGNELVSIGAFVRSILPEAEVRELVRNNSLKIGSGGAVRQSYGKAHLNMRLDQIKRELAIVISVDP